MGGPRACIEYMVILKWIVRPAAVIASWLVQTRQPRRYRMSCVGSLATCHIVLGPQARTTCALVSMLVSIMEQITSANQRGVVPKRAPATWLLNIELGTTSAFRSMFCSRGI